MSDSNLSQFPSIGFGRGGIVRLKQGGENMLVVRSLDTTTAVIVCESDKPGNIRLREFRNIDLEQILPPRGAYEEQRAADNLRTF